MKDVVVAEEGAEEAVGVEAVGGARRKIQTFHNRILIWIWTNVRIIKYI